MPVRSGMLGTSQSGNGAPAAAATTSMDSGFDAGLSSGMNGDEALFEITSLAAQGAESAGGLDNAAGQSVSVCMQKEEEEWECASQHSSHSSQYDEGLRIPGVHAGETKRLCAVCLEHYSDGEKVRQLPCQHRYHMSCIDQWLSTRRVCPVCKHDASKPLSLSPPPLAVAAGTGPTTAGTSSTGVGSTGGTAAVPNEAATSGRGAVSLLPGWMRSAWTFMYGGAPARWVLYIPFHNVLLVCTGHMLTGNPASRPSSAPCVQSLASLDSTVSSPCSTRLPKLHGKPQWCWCFKQGCSKES